MNEHPAPKMQHAPQQAKDGEQNHSIHPFERCALFAGGGDCGCSHQFCQESWTRPMCRDSSSDLIFLKIWRWAFCWPPDSAFTPDELPLQPNRALSRCRLL